jgi:hypothetical protein
LGSLYEATFIESSGGFVMKRYVRLVGLLVVFAGTIAMSANPALAQPPNVVIQWNQLLQTLFGPAPGPALRALPMMHIAMFDAINSIEHAYTPYRVHVAGSHGASAEAAAAQAARDVLAALYPAEQAKIDAALASQLASLPPGRAQQGRAIGSRAAKAVLEWRKDDGWPAVVAPDPSYVLPPFPGLWQPTPPANSAPTFTFFPRVVPFAMLTSTQFLPPPPPTLTSARYAQDFNETMLLGSATSTVRTAEQTLTTQVFAGVNTSIGFFHVWNIVAGTVAHQKRLSLIDTARMFVLVNVGLHDGLQTSFTSKFVYNLWRPVTAIRRADEDLNPDTTADPTWTPLLATPPYPGYAGNAACQSAASARALELSLGSADVPFSVTVPRTMGLPSVTRDFKGFWDLADQQARSRIYGGIHFQFESDASRAACVKVPEFTHANFMVRRSH